MERKDSKEHVNLILTFLDIFPSLQEIDENNYGITITFQNSSFSYNLSEFIKTLDELFLPNQIPNQSIKVNLLKSDNLYASGLLTIKNGEQWVTFSYEHKKKASNNLALNLIDCIKIKFMCKMDYIVSNMDKINSFLPNSEMSKNDNNNLLIKPSPKKLYNNLTSKKKSGSGYVNNTVEIIGDNMDSVHTEQSKISKILENITPEFRYNDNNLNNTTLPSNKKSNKNNLVKSENFSEYNPLAASSGVVGKDFRIRDNNKNKNMKKFSNNHLNQKKKSYNNKLANNTLQEKEKEKQKSNNNNSLNKNGNTLDNKQKSNNLKRNRSKTNIDNQNKPNKKEKHTKSLTNDLLQNMNNNMNQKDSSKKIKKEYSLKNIIPKKEEETNEDNNKNLGNFYNNYNKLINQISKEIKDNRDKYNEEINNKDNEINYNEDMFNEDFEQNGFYKKLEDFKLMYNDDYIESINKEDYSLEIELFIEKLIELIIEYHLQVEEKEIEYQLIKNVYHKNIHLLNEQNKLNKKLQLLTEDSNIKEKNKKTIINLHTRNKKNNILANKIEVNLFKYIVYSNQEKENKENKEKLKKILKKLLSKSKNINIINKNEKMMKWVKINIDKSLSIKDKAKNNRINTAKSQKSQYEDKYKTNSNKKRKNINNINNTPPKGKNKFNKK